MMKAQLLEKFERRTAKVGVIGLGYVGLPLAVEFAREGFHVVGYDVSERVVKLINDGKSHIKDVAGTAVAELVKAGRLEATTDPTRLKELDAISIAVPTPTYSSRSAPSASIRATRSGTRRTHRKWWAGSPRPVAKSRQRSTAPASTASYRCRHQRPRS
jgi:UDP-N-acetyl-D-glucosamine dehydrogenase